MNINIFIKLLIILFFINNCFVHYAKVIPEKKIEDSDKEILKALPVDIDFNPEKQKDKIIQNFDARMDYDLILTYSSDEIISSFKRSPGFNFSKNANVNIKVRTFIDKENLNAFSFLGFVFTLGIIPSITNIEGRIEFRPFDKELNKSIKSYKYKIKHKFFIGFLPMLIGPFLKDASYSLEHTKGYESKTVMKVSFDQFASDLKKDVSKNEFYLSRFKVSNSSTYYLRDNLINKDNTLKKEFISSNTIRRGN